jgi:hypothetical protein
MQRYGALGRTMVRNESGLAWDENRTIRVQSKTNIGGLGLDRTVDGETITYSYHFEEYQGTETHRSQDRLLESSSKCLERVMRDGELYERGKKIEIPGKCLRNVSYTRD